MVKVTLAKVIPWALTSLGRKVRIISKMGWKQVFESPVRIANAIFHSRSQLNQDLAMLVTTGFQSGGFFVEVGASHPSRFSNTYLLEKFFGFRGVLIEPNPAYHELLRAQRSSPLCTRPLWDQRKKVKFLLAGTLSSIGSLTNTKAARNRKPNGEIVVETITWDDLCLEFKIPLTIDMLSIDVEGEELTILRSIDFSRYRFKFICVEHNFMPVRQEIFELLGQRGYERILSHISEWDDFYVPASKN